MHHFHKLVHKTMRRLSCVPDQKPAQAEALVGQTPITLLRRHLHVFTGNGVTCPIGNALHCVRDGFKNKSAHLTL